MLVPASIGTIAVPGTTSATTGERDLRIAVVVKGRSESTLYSSGELATAYLDLVCDAPTSFAMLCDSQLPDASSDSPKAAEATVANGEVDLVVTTGLGCIADWTDQVLKFLRHCAKHDVRVIAFEDKVDTAEAGWDDRIMQGMLDDLFAR